MDGYFKLPLTNMIEMSSLNNKLVYHSLSTTRPSQMLIPRLKKQKMTISLIEPENVNIIHYFGRKKPSMPCVPEVNLNDIFIHMKQISRARVQIIDFQFFKGIATKIECPEYNGYC